MAEPVWIPISPAELSGRDLLVERKLIFLYGTESLERYLERMAAKGWILRCVSPLGFKCTFVRGEPQKIRYFVDYGWVDFKGFFRRMFDFASTRRLKCLPYDGARPEDRRSLLSQMVMNRYTQCMLGLFLLVNAFAIGPAAADLFKTLGQGIPQTMTIEWNGIDYLSIFINVVLTGMVGALVFFTALLWAALLVEIIYLQVKHSRAKRRLRHSV